MEENWKGGSYTAELHYVRKMQSSLPFASRSIRFFGAWCWGGRRPVFCACADFLWAELILNCFSSPLFPRSHRCCASTLPTQNATQPSSAFRCTLGCDLGSAEHASNKTPGFAPNRPGIFALTSSSRATGMSLRRGAEVRPELPLGRV